MSSWYDWSQDESDITDGVTASYIAYFGIALATFVVAHSLYKNRLEYKPVQICTEITAVSTWIACLLTIISVNMPSRITNAVINELMVTGMLNWICQVSDNVIFYLRYAACTHVVPKWKTYATAAYILIVMSSSWMPTYCINPFITDTNSEEYLNDYYTPGQLIYTWGNVLYNGYFTIEFILILYRVYVLESKQYSAAAQSISIKCIIHFFGSTGAVLQLYYAYSPLQAVLLYIIVLMTNMHFLFNYKVETIFAKATAKDPLDVSNHALSARVWTQIKQRSSKSFSNQLPKIAGIAYLAADRTRQSVGAVVPIA